MSKIVDEKALRLHPEPIARHTNICTYHRRLVIGQIPRGRAATTKTNATSRKDLHQTLSAGRQQQQQIDADSASDDEDEEDDGIIEQHSTVAPLGQMLQLHLLSASTLRRYKKHFRLNIRAKQQLADAVLDHFQTLPVNEREILTYFIYTVKTCRNTIATDA